VEFVAVLEGVESMSPIESKEAEFYHKLRHSVTIWAGGEKSKTNRYASYILVAPDLFMLLVRLSQDSRVSKANKAKLAGAVLYFMNPLDFIPEIVLGPAGLVDDLALSAFVLHDVLETTDPAVVREHWEGSPDILDLVRRILAVADSMVGGPIWRRLIARVRSFGSPAEPG
jgi:uncharacterized membrane protein YkvA (DUF1232 family)